MDHTVHKRKGSQEADYPMRTMSGTFAFLSEHNKRCVKVNTLTDHLTMSRVKYYPSSLEKVKTPFSTSACRLTFVL